MQIHSRRKFLEKCAHFLPHRSFFYSFNCFYFKSFLTELHASCRLSDLWHDEIYHESTTTANIVISIILGSLAKSKAHKNACDVDRNSIKMVQRRNMLLNIFPFGIFMLYVGMLGQSFYGVSSSHKTRHPIFRTCKHMFGIIINIQNVFSQ